MASSILHAFFRVRWTPGLIRNECNDKLRQMNTFREELNIRIACLKFECIPSPTRNGVELTNHVINESQLMVFHGNSALFYLLNV